MQSHLNHGDLLGSCLSNCDILCNDGNACTVDACDPTTEHCQAEHPPVTCAEGQSCDPPSGECVGGGVGHIPCTQLLSCDGGQSCDLTSGECVTVSCNDPSLSCGGGKVCDLTSGACVVGSCTDSSVVCNAGMECEPLSGECRYMFPPPCSQVSNCEGGQSCDLRIRQCVTAPCTDPLMSCGEGKVCDLTSGQCMVGSCTIPQWSAMGAWTVTQSGECRLTGPPLAGGCSSTPPLSSGQPLLTPVCVGNQWQWRYNI